MQRPERRDRLALCLVVASTALLVTTAAGAQSACSSRRPVPVGSEWENYLRLAQVVGAVRAAPWTLRAFGPQQLLALEPTDSTLPWSSERSGARAARCVGRLAVAPIDPRAQILANSSFPFGGNDGAIWAGRGLTTAVEGGFTANIGVLTITVAPLIFVAENAVFTIKPNGQAGDQAFADWRNPTTIDLPQRFGSGAYGVLDPGQSEARIDTWGATLGISTANEYWGPATDHPIVLGNNAPGFVHAFAGTARPLRVWKIGTMHGRLLWGRLTDSPYSPLADSAGARLASGIAFVFQPGAVPFLELGASRFFHVPQARFRPDLGEILRPVSFLPNVEIATAPGQDNQLGSVFARLVLPRDSMEVYAEYGLEDRIGTPRRWVQFLDHEAAYLIGGRKSWRRGSSLMSLRGEILNSRVTHLAISSTQASWYVHTVVRQGHTHKGQALGSWAAYAGGASVLALDQYDSHGRLTLSWERAQLGDSRLPAPDLLRNDVAHAWRISRLRFGRRVDVDARLAMIYEMNRHLVRDAWGAQASLSLGAGSQRARP